MPFAGDGKWLSDGISQLTMGSFQSVHSNAVEKNRILYTLLQHGVETTVDRTQKNSRIINWINQQTADEKDSNDENDSEEEDDDAIGDADIFLRRNNGAGGGGRGGFYQQSEDSRGSRDDGLQEGGGGGGGGDAGLAAEGV